MRYRWRLLLLQQPPRLAIPQAAGLLHDFQRLGEGDEEGHGGGSEVAIWNLLLDNQSCAYSHTRAKALVR